MLQESHSDKTKRRSVPGRRCVLPENEGDKGLTLTAAVKQRFHTEAAMFGRYHEPTGTGVLLVVFR